ncbi:unnamed protein product [Vitrella brassicaformis CCMP3155]|uniref:Uncharacterized protein n=1 Tax=Vitrella brassicaformis (strain CCMP3155) TaxID=1169540 RepID=A0A0G4E9P1_VITBC|nr:unnamed protein product [Vitrella brassicaformis CCMP3155]|eukprot:CEL91909.1 unnamed protein product [Vitrella brassicaformis CCMP3155]
MIEVRRPVSRSAAAFCCSVSFCRSQTSDDEQQLPLQGEDGMSHITSGKFEVVRRIEEGRDGKNTGIWVTEVLEKRQYRGAVAGLHVTAVQLRMTTSATKHVFDTSLDRLEDSLSCRLVKAFRTIFLFILWASDMRGKALSESAPGAADGSWAGDESVHLKDNQEVLITMLTDFLSWLPVDTLQGVLIRIMDASTTRYGDEQGVNNRRKGVEVALHSLASRYAAQHWCVKPSEWLGGVVSMMLNRRSRQLSRNMLTAVLDVRRGAGGGVKRRFRHDRKKPPFIPSELALRKERDSYLCLTWDSDDGALSLGNDWMAAEPLKAYRTARASSQWFESVWVNIDNNTNTSILWHTILSVLPEGLGAQMEGGVPVYCRSVLLRADGGENKS